MNNNNSLYPLKFKPILKERIWGGNRLSSVLGKKTDIAHCGESWELSGVQGDVSTVSNGLLQKNNLQELIEIYMGDLVGEKVYAQFGIEFPILIKFIDAQDDLSIQVHPDDKLAGERHHSYGKTEMWYVMEADKNSKLIVGFKKGTDKESYLSNLENKTLPEILNFEKVEKGDVFFIPAGRIHAICKGIMLAEIQQTSDVTYRIYDWDRTDAQGKPREMHTELAIDAIDYNSPDEYKSPYTKPNNGTTGVVECPFFTTNIVCFDKLIDKDYSNLDSFVIYICTTGSCLIRYNNNESVAIKKGEIVLIPASIQSLSLVPTEPTELLEVYMK